MEGKLQHVSHEHLLILKAEEHKTTFGVEIECDGCSTPISGPFYSCGECLYYLHKVCAELPNKLDHPLHRQHPLTFLSHSPYSVPFECNLCRQFGSKFVYNCSICHFNVDMICASATHAIKEECHPHPLTPSQLPISFPCHICRTKEEGLSYKCNICPFWVHQNCTLLPDTVKHSYHRHLLTLMPLVPFEHYMVSKYCDICHDKLFMFECIYCCLRCLFFAHVSCARSENIQSSSRARDQNTEINQDLPLVLLPMKQKSTDLISRYVEDYIDKDANIDNKLDHFDHEHPLFLIDEQMNEKVCDACVVPISSPFYGCIECDYFLHKCCTDLPKLIHHPSLPDHTLILQSASILFMCHCCYQWCSGFFYGSSRRRDFKIDIKCASLQGSVYYEAHKHPLIPIFISSSLCSACDSDIHSQCILQCDECSFKLCFMCVMTPPTVKHRYGKLQPFILTYSPPENHYSEYICELCEEGLNPKSWYYHCLYADQFTHINCMRKCGFDSNIKYGKSYMSEVHEHMLALISCTYSCTPCSYCREPLRTGFNVGLECIPCNFRIHLECVHISSGRSETTQLSSGSRSQDSEINRDLPLVDQTLVFLPMKQKSTDLISLFVEKYIDQDANIDKRLDHFDHEHTLLLLYDEDAKEKLCEACAIPISSPSYACIDCDYFLHKCCAELPKQILHPSQPKHHFILTRTPSFYFWCRCCYQWCNGFSYQCSKIEDFLIDIKCASLQGTVYYEAHKHPLIPRFISSNTCSACDVEINSQCLLQCDTCGFNLCFPCAMLPPIVKFYNEEPNLFILTYTPENRRKRYRCNICFEAVNPKFWFYKCLYLGQSLFTHTSCMRYDGADLNIKYGKSIKLGVHTHALTFVRCTMGSANFTTVQDFTIFPDDADCSFCCKPLSTGFSAGLECIPCKIRIHLQCVDQRPGPPTQTQKSRSAQEDLESKLPKFLQDFASSIDSDSIIQSLNTRMLEVSRNL